MSVGSVVYELIKNAWGYGYQVRIGKAGAILESATCVGQIIAALTAVNVSGSTGGLQEFINKNGGKINPMVNTQGIKPPRITYQVVGNDPSDTKYAASKLDQVRVKVACHARYYEDAEAVLRDIRKNIDRFTGTVAGVKVQSVQFLTQEDQYSENADVVGIANDYKFRIER